MIEVGREVIVKSDCDAPITMWGRSGVVLSVSNKIAHIKLYDNAVFVVEIEFLEGV
jgi:hypothetical protein